MNAPSVQHFQFEMMTQILASVAVKTIGNMNRFCIRRSYTETLGASFNINTFLFFIGGVFEGPVGVCNGKQEKLSTRSSCYVD